MHQVLKELFFVWLYQTIEWSPPAETQNIVPKT